MFYLLNLLNAIPGENKQTLMRYANSLKIINLLHFNTAMHHDRIDNRNAKEVTSGNVWNFSEWKFSIRNTYLRRLKKFENQRHLHND